MINQLIAHGRRLLRLSSRQVATILKSPATLSGDLNGFDGTVEIFDVPTFHVGAIARIGVRVVNRGKHPWPAEGLQAVALGYHWRRPDYPDFLIQDDGNRSALPRTVNPGAKMEAACYVRAPGTFGDYELEIDLFRNLAGWFAQRQERSRRRVSVEGLSGDNLDPDFSYHDFYRHADLRRDHWTVVGPRTPEEFQLLAQGQLRLLQDHGLTPDCRVLDVGCGTGKLAGPLLDFLSDRGAYVGTDLAPEAVEFCKAKYHRHNFRFLQNDMTRLPIEEETFDVIYLASVWTHMFPEEIAAMLADLKRLLSNGGFILADAFHSPHVPDHTPSRGMVEINKDKLFAILSASGLHWSEVHSHAYNSRTTRTIFRFEHEQK